MFSLLRSSGQRISVGPLSRRDWLTCHPSPPVSLFLSASLTEYLWYTNPRADLDWLYETKNVGYISAFENGVLWMRKNPCAPVTSYPHSHSPQNCLRCSFPSFTQPIVFFCHSVSLDPSPCFYLDRSAPLGWWMCLISHLDLSSIRSQTLCLSCSRSLDTTRKRTCENTHSIPVCTLCLMLSLWTGDLASMGNIPWGDTGCVCVFERQSEEEIVRECTHRPSALQ